MTPARPTWPGWRWALTGLILLALALSSYLSWHYVVGGAVIGCGGGSPCDQVLNSQWSAIGGVLPVSGLAAGAYLAMLVASFFIATADASVRRLAWRALLVLSGAAAGSAGWFTIVQHWFIGAFCPYCMATHLTGLVLATLIIWQAPRQLDRDSTETTPTPPAPNVAPRRATPLLPAVGYASVGLALAGLMALAQVRWTPPAVYRDGESSQKNFTVLDPRHVPLLGSPDARYVVTLLFDYQCPHCQQLHLLLDAAIKRYDGQLAFALAPTPLNSPCNPYLTRDVDAFKDSCELAKIALAVWVAQPTAFAAFDHWMYAPEPDHLWHPRTLDAAQTKAAELVGPAKLAAALADPWINRHLQTALGIYGATGDTAVPKLIFGSRWVTPQPHDADALLSLLNQVLGVPAP
jgi:uncharacterized membrane protein/protein-disulfide isomerase